MIKYHTNYIKNLVTAIAVTLFFGCSNDFDDVQKVGVLQNQPIGEAENIDLKYTEFQEDTVKLLANLLSPKMLDYSNRDFAFSEFPDGIELKIYDDDDNKTTITSRYAIFYSETDVIDLRGNVISKESITNLTTPKHNLRLNNAVNGLYFVSIQTNEGVKTKKLIIAY